MFYLKHIRAFLRVKIGRLIKYLFRSFIKYNDKIYRQYYRETHKEQRRAWAKANYKKLREWRKKYYETNKIRIIQYRKEYSKSFSQSDRAQLAKKQKIYADSHREQYRAYNRWYKPHLKDWIHFMKQEEAKNNERK